MLEHGAAAATATDPLVELLMSPTVEEIREHLRCLRNIAEKGGAVERLAVAANASNVFRRDDDFWSISYRGRSSRLRDCLGLGYLARLLSQPGRAVPAIEVAVGVQQPGEPFAQPRREDVLLDCRARAEYRARLSELAGELEDAKAANDLGRCEPLAREMEAIGEQLGGALGLGGHARRFASESERARLNVTRAIRSAIARIGSADPALGEHLSRAVRTGRFCSYDPDPAALPNWEL